TPIRLGVEAGLECIAASAAEPLAHTPVRAAAAEREAGQDVGVETVVHAAGDPIEVAGQIMCACRGVTVDVVGTPVGGPPGAPALVETHLYGRFGRRHDGVVGRADV